MTKTKRETDRPTDRQTDRQRILQIDRIDIRRRQDAIVERVVERVGRAVDGKKQKAVSKL